MINSLKVLFLLSIMSLVACGGGGATSENTASEGPKEVAGPSSVNTTLKWVAPVARADGTPIVMSEIKGYGIYVGTSPETLTLIDVVEDAYEMEYDFSTLEKGQYYFTVSVYDMDNREGSFSEVVSQAI